MSNSSSDTTCTQVCEKLGHDIQMFNQGAAPTELFLCTQCGKTLGEITYAPPSKLRKLLGETA